MVVDVSHCMTKGPIEHTVVTYVVLVVANIKVDGAMNNVLKLHILYSMECLL